MASRSRDVSSAEVQTDVGAECVFADQRELDAALMKAADAEERFSERQEVVVRLEDDIARLQALRERDVAKVGCSHLRKICRAELQAGTGEWKRGLSFGDDLRAPYCRSRKKRRVR